MAYTANICVLLFLFSATDTCKALSVSKDVSTNGIPNDVSINLSFSTDLSSVSATSSFVHSRKGTKTTYPTLSFIKESKTSAPTSTFPEIQFEVRQTDPPKLLLGGMIVSRHFVEDRHFEEIRVEDPSKSNETIEIFDTEMLETEISETSMGRLKNVPLDKKETLLKTRHDFGDFEATHKRKKHKTTETSIDNMMVSQKDQKTKNLKHSTLYGKVTSVSPVFKYLYPAVLGICLLTTIVLVFALSKKQRRDKSQMNKASCILLIAVAVADSMTICFALAEVSYRFRKTEENNGFLPFETCRTMFVLERLSAIPHAASTWITVILAVQRFLCVSKPFSAGKYIKVKSAWIYILLLCIVAIGFHIYRFFDMTFVSVNVSINNITITSCYARYVDWIVDADVYESVFAWTRIVIMQFLPSIMIVSFVILMIRALRNATLKSKNISLEDGRLNSERRKLSLFVAAVALIVFCVEISSGLFLSINAWGLTTGHVLIPSESLKTASVAFDLILYLSYFAVFLLYCLMSKDLRKKILQFCMKRMMIRLNHHNSSGKSVTSTPRLPPSTADSCNRARVPIKNEESFNHHIVTKM